MDTKLGDHFLMIIFLFEKNKKSTEDKLMLKLTRWGNGWKILWMIFQPITKQGGNKQSSRLYHRVPHQQESSTTRS